MRWLLYEFKDKDIAELEPYSKADKEKWASSNPLNAVMTFNIYGAIMGIPAGNIDDASVICSDYKETSWIFSTIQNPQDFQHPVSGNRQFGLKYENYEYIFFTRGADRLTGVMDEQLGDPTAFDQADKLWKSMLSKITEFVISHNGQVKSDRIFSERFVWKK